MIRYFIINELNLNIKNKKIFWQNPPIETKTQKYPRRNVMVEVYDTYGQRRRGKVVAEACTTRLQKPSINFTIAVYLMTVRLLVVQSFLSPLSFSRIFEDKEAVGSDYLDFYLSFSFGFFFCLDRFNPSALILRFFSLSFNVCFCDYELALKTADLSSEENGSLRILFYSYQIKSFWI